MLLSALLNVLFRYKGCCIGLNISIYTTSWSPGRRARVPTPRRPLFGHGHTARAPRALPGALTHYLAQQPPTPRTYSDTSRTQPPHHRTPPARPPSRPRTPDTLSSAPAPPPTAGARRPPRRAAAGTRPSTPAPARSRASRAAGSSAPRRSPPARPRRGPASGSRDPRPRARGS